VAAAEKPVEPVSQRRSDKAGDYRKRRRQTEIPNYQKEWKENARQNDRTTREAGASHKKREKGVLLGLGRPDLPSPSDAQIRGHSYDERNDEGSSQVWKVGSCKDPGKGNDEHVENRPNANLLAIVLANLYECVGKSQ